MPAVDMTLARVLPWVLTLALASPARAQPGVDSLPDNICEEVKVYDYAQKQCVDPSLDARPGQSGAGESGGHGDDMRPSWRLPSFVEELACSCAERDCACGLALKADAPHPHACTACAFAGI